MDEHGDRERRPPPNRGPLVGYQSPAGNQSRAWVRVKDVGKRTGREARKKRAKRATHTMKRLGVIDWSNQEGSTIPAP